MSILTKVLLGFVVIAIFPVIFLAAGVLNVNNIWRNKVATLTATLEAEQKQNEILKNGDFLARTSTYRPPLKAKGTLGVAQLIAARDALKVGRSRMWQANLNAQSIDEANQAVTIQMVLVPPEPLPVAPLPAHGIKDAAQVFLFSNPTFADIGKTKSAFEKNNHRYLGEFVVSGLVVGPEGVPANNNLPLKATMPMTAEEWQQVRQAGGDIVVYDAMPSDEHDVFLGLTPEEIKTYLPDSSVEQYLADGQDIEKFPALKADPELSQSVEDGVDPSTGAKVKLFRRPLRRYDHIFRDYSDRIVDVSNELLLVTKEFDYAKRAEKRGVEEGMKLDASKLAAEAELKVLQREQAIVKAHLDVLEAKVAELTKELKTQLDTNKRLTEEIAGRKTAMMAPPADATAQAADAKALVARIPASAE
jgi:hypothetical protein